MILKKYHGLGNDFLIGHDTDIPSKNRNNLAKKLCHRHKGIGADGLIIVKENPLEMIYYNSDGSRAKMCGNGIRCFAKYVLDTAILTNREFDVVTLAGVKHLKITSISPFFVEVNMGVPDMTPSMIPVNSDKPVINQEFEVANQTIVLSTISMGVPHSIIDKKDIKQDTLVTLGQQIQALPLFKEGTNVNFYTFVDSSTIKLKTVERGAGLTLACGTGAAATVALLQHLKRVKNEVEVILPLGSLYIRKENDQMMMKGPAEYICDISFVK